MDIKLSDVPTVFTANTLKRALAAGLSNIDNSFKSDFLVYLDFNIEQVQWDRLAEKKPPATALLVLPNVDLANKFLKAAASNDGITVSLLMNGKTINYDVDAKMAEPQLTLASEFQRLQAANFQVDDDKPASVWSGIISEVSAIQCGLFWDDGTFDHAATWNPSKPFDWLSWFGDVNTRKFEVGVSYKKGETGPASWTGEWIDFRIRELSHIIVSQPEISGNISEIYLLMDKPPRFYRRKLDALGEARDYRVPLLNVQNHEPSWPVQYCRVYRLQLQDRPSDRPPLTYDFLKTQLLSQDVGGKLKLRTLNIAKRSATSSRFNQDHVDEIRKFAGQLDVAPAFTYHKLLLNGYTTPWELYSLSERIKTILGKAKSQASDFLDFVMKRVSKSHLRALPGPSNRRFLLDEALLESLWAEFSKKTVGQAPTQGMFKVVIYASHLEVRSHNEPEENRILRKYPDSMKDMLLVTFNDGTKQNFDTEGDTEMSQLINERVVASLKGPLDIAGRLYDFLGFSNSSLKEQKQVWFLSRSGTLTAENVLNRTGIWNNASDADDIKLQKSPSKWASRLAQAFTTTKAVANLEAKEWIVIADVKTDLGKYTFTDGVGLITEAFRKEINDERSRISGKNPAVAPSAFQIRFAGAKGVVCVAADRFFPSGVKMILRKSMVKFHVPGERGKLELEIVSAAVQRPLPTFNMALIKLMEGYFQPDSAQFKKMYELFSNEVARLASTDASSLKTAQNLAQEHHSGDLFGLAFLLNALENNQINWTSIKGSFIHQVVVTLLGEYSKLVRSGFKVTIPNSYSGLGVVDEYALLEPGEVYVRCRSVNVTGNVLVYRNPVIHPGDAQLATALSDDEIKRRAQQKQDGDAQKQDGDAQKQDGDAQKLCELDNVVVFSRSNKNGSRPLPSMLSGGDLDGDLYCVLSSDSDFVPESSKIFPAADYEPEQAVELPGGQLTKVSDICDAIGKFLRYDCMGQLSTLLLIVSDRKDQGLRDPTCLEISSLISRAVDFQKSGNEVDYEVVSKRPELAARRRPDFLRKPEKRYLKDTRHEYYESPNLLGQLFRIPDAGRFEQFAINNSELVKAIAKLAPKKQLDAQSLVESTLAVILEDYRVSLWAIFRNALENGIALYEADLFLLSDSMADDSEALHTVKEDMGELMEETEANLLRQVQKVVAIEDERVRQGIYFTAWTLGIAKLPEISIEGPEPVPPNFGMSFAFMGLRLFLEPDN